MTLTHHSTGKTEPTVTTLHTACPYKLWLLRILVALGGHQKFVHAHGFQDDSLADALELTHWLNPDQPGFNPCAVRAELRAKHVQAEQAGSVTQLAPGLQSNVARLSTLVGLTATDCRILEFVVSMQTERLIDDTADLLGPLSSVKVFHTLSVVLNLPEADVRNALHPQGVLSVSGLVSVDRRSTSSLRGKLDLLSDGFSELMTTLKADPVNLLRGTISVAPAAQLQLQNYAHIQPSLQILRPYLQQASAAGRCGVNIFFHGAPGTGKSQLARVLAADLGCELFEVASEDEDGDPINGERRLRAFRAAQSFFANQRSLIVFDEIEDVFNDGDLFGRKSTAQVRKAWINRILEQNPVPTLWLSNSMRGLDRAFIRRFDMVFELPVPPRAQRLDIIGQHCQCLIDDNCAARIADIETLAPAVVAKAASVVRIISAQLDPAQRAQAMEHLISNTLQAQGHGNLRQHDANRLPALYDPAWVNADADLLALAEGLKCSGSGRLCLYGPPGTGKTAYARWLAEQLAMPLLVKRASDLMSPYVGENERNIAQAFQQAGQDGALLLIDEVDSFFQDRQRAQRHWESSQVNEMLTQMESFAGIFMASTNLLEGLDSASLRRFDLKVKFDFLQAGQAAQLLSYCCQQLGLPPPDSAQVTHLRHLRHLTPGDFALVQRQHRFQRIHSVDKLLAALQAECILKTPPGQPIGFLHAA